jgi:predicted helicase
MEILNLKPAHKPIREYYKALEHYESLSLSHEGAVKVAFQNLLSSCCSQAKWNLVTEWKIERPSRRPAFVDGACVNEFRLVHGYWEAKDESDDLKKEVKKKFAEGYPKNNILFQAPTRAILWQDGKQRLDADITNPVNLIQVLQIFFEYTPPAIKEWDQAVIKFQDKVPELASALSALVKKERRNNRRFIDSFSEFYEICRQAINPELREEEVEVMIIQHLLTERIFRKVFNNPDFTRRNIIAIEIEKVIQDLTSRSFSREDFLGKLDHFYKAIEQTAATISDFSQKQDFLNAVYEKFFQGFSPDVADRHGIVYTPQSIVNFMVKSVSDILTKEFGRSLNDPEVQILDPFVGTGNFIVRIMQELKRTALGNKYRNELHCNEIMLLPYYVASMNIEHKYFELTENYEPFPGICLVDTFELAEGKQRKFSFMTPENTIRVEKQKISPIFVIIGNPPYNVGQSNENDNNKNRKYEVVDKRIKESYAKDSTASSVSKLSNPYIRALRWASDRIEGEGVVAFITNSGFIDNRIADGLRMHLAKDFDLLYILDLGGDTRKNPKLSGTTHNVFGIPNGVSINLLIRKQNKDKTRCGNIYYARVDEFWRKREKFEFLDSKESSSNVVWKLLKPDENNNWLTEGLQKDFKALVPIGDKETKRGKSQETALFFKYSIGINTNRDPWVYNFDSDQLLENLAGFVETYNADVSRWFAKTKQERDSINIDDFIMYDDKRIKWSSRLKECLLRGQKAILSKEKIRKALYRPFCQQYLYFDKILIHRLGRFPIIFPTPSTEKENVIICVGGYGRKAFSVLASKFITDLNFYGDPQQSFPFYIYDEDGTNRRENITDWALAQFRSHFPDHSITKLDIFYYVYAIMHHPKYRERYLANLKKEFPRIPFLFNRSDFQAFRQAGKRLIDLHLNYEDQPEYPLERIENPREPLNWLVERMKLSKDKTSIVYNDFLTLSGVPPQTFEYRLGNRSALEWIIDQYREKLDNRSGIIKNPNRLADEQYIVRLLGKVVTVSLETIKTINSLPDLGIASDK